MITDWGGVLTTRLHEVMSGWAAEDGVDYEHFRAIMRDWLGRGYGGRVQTSPVHALERGEIDRTSFERLLAARLRTRDGRPVSPDGLLERMFAGFEAVADMHQALRRARASGVRTCLLSNSWGLDYPRDGWDDLFDAVVISGEVRMRKPEPRIYRYAAAQLGVPAYACVFVDDIRANVLAAADCGMVGVHHLSAEQTLDELEALFGIPLRDPEPRRASP